MSLIFITALILFLAPEFPDANKRKNPTLKWDINLRRDLSEKVLQNVVYVSCSNGPLQEYYLPRIFFFRGVVIYMPLNGFAIPRGDHVDTFVTSVNKFGESVPSELHCFRNGISSINPPRCVIAHSKWALSLIKGDLLETLRTSGDLSEEDQKREVIRKAINWLTIQLPQFEALDPAQLPIDQRMAWMEIMIFLQDMRISFMSSALKDAALRGVNLQYVTPLVQ